MFEVFEDVRVSRVAAAFKGVRFSRVVRVRSLLSAVLMAMCGARFGSPLCSLRLMWQGTGTLRLRSDSMLVRENILLGALLSVMCLRSSMMMCLVLVVLLTKRATTMTDTFRSRSSRYVRTSVVCLWGLSTESVLLSMSARGCTVSMLVSVRCRPRLLDRSVALCCLKLERLIVVSVLAMWVCSLLAGMLRPLGLNVMLLLMTLVMTRLLGPRNMRFMWSWTLQMPWCAVALRLLIAMRLELGMSRVLRRCVSADPFELPFFRMSMNLLLVTARSMLLSVLRALLQEQRRLVYLTTCVCRFL